MADEPDRCIHVPVSPGQRMHLEWLVQLQAEHIAMLERRWQNRGRKGSDE
jgi:hypothetical protein